ncbi:MAG: copper-binding protein [Campylobacteraceae bacterium]
MKKIVLSLTAVAISATLSLAQDHSMHQMGNNMGSMHQSMNADTKKSDEVSTKGVVKAIDKTTKKVTIEHEPIASLSWPAMTMRFTYEDESLIKDLKVNDKISFNFVQQGTVSLLKSISVETK